MSPGRAGAGRRSAAGLGPPHFHFEGGVADQDLVGLLGVRDLEEPDPLVPKDGIDRQRVGDGAQPGGQRRAAQQRVRKRAGRPGGAGRQAAREIDVGDHEGVPRDEHDVGDVAPQDQGARRFGRGRGEDFGRGLQAVPVLPVERAQAAEAAIIHQRGRGVGRAEDHTGSCPARRRSQWARSRSASAGDLGRKKTTRAGSGRAR